MLWLFNKKKINLCNNTRDESIKYMLYIYCKIELSLNMIITIGACHDTFNFFYA